MADAKAGPGGTGKPAELQQHMDQIGDRFIQRLLAELAMMREIIADARAGDDSGLKDVELFAHKIHGSSAMFGFTAVSQLAGELEGVLGAERLKGADAPPDLDAIEAQFARLDAAGKAVSQQRGAG